MKTQSKLLLIEVMVVALIVLAIWVVEWALTRPFAEERVLLVQNLAERQDTLDGLGEELLALKAELVTAIIPSSEAADRQQFTDATFDFVFSYPADWIVTTGSLDGEEASATDSGNTFVEVEKGGYRLRIISNWYGYATAPTNPLSSAEISIDQQKLYRREIGETVTTTEADDYSFESSGNLSSIDYADSVFGSSFSYRGTTYGIIYYLPDSEVRGDEAGERIGAMDSIVGTLRFI